MLIVIDVVIRYIFTSNLPLLSCNLSYAPSTSSGDAPFMDYSHHRDLLLY